MTLVRRLSTLVVGRHQPRIRAALLDVREPVDWTELGHQHHGGELANPVNRLQQLSLPGRKEGLVGDPIQLQTAFVEVREHVEPAVDLGETEFSERLALTLQAEDPILVRDASPEEDGVEVVLDVPLLAHVEHPVPYELSEIANCGVRGTVTEPRRRSCAGASELTRSDFKLASEITRTLYGWTRVASAPAEHAAS